MFCGIDVVDTFVAGTVAVAYGLGGGAKEFNLVELFVC